jgi:energy-coupling factor transporter ATP-binding protein EcfA2
LEWAKANFTHHKKQNIKFRELIYTPQDLEKFLMKNPDLLLSKPFAGFFELSREEMRSKFQEAVVACLPAPEANPDQAQSLIINPHVRHIIENYDLINLRTPEMTRQIFVEKGTHTPADFTVEAIKAMTPNKLWEEIRCSPDFLTPHYDPFALASKQGFINLYTLPPWKKIKDAKPEITEKMKFFFEFLFPEQESRDVAMRWILRSIKGRAQEYLVLCGPQGSGKSLFAGTLLKTIHGEQNFFLGKEDFITNHFIGYIENKTLGFIDEFSVWSRAQGDVLKNRINDSLMIEGKFQNQRTITNTCSFVLATNYYYAIHIDPTTPRRFSVPELTDKNLLTEMGEVWVDHLVSEMKDDETIANFMAWLTQNYSYKKFEAYHGKTYERMTKESALPEIKFIVNRIFEKQNPKLSIADMRLAFLREHGFQGRSVYPSIETITEFFKAFRWENKQVAEVRDLFIFPINDFVVNDERQKI